MRTRALLWLGLAAAILIAAGFVYWRSPLRHAVMADVSPLTVVPPGAALVLTVDVPRLNASPAGAELLKRSAGLLGLGNDDCAARILRSTTSLLLAVDGAAEKLAEPGPSDLAIVAAGPLGTEPVAACVEQAVVKKKGKPVRTMLGSFVTVRDQLGSSGEVAVRDGGPLVISDGRYLRNILDAADGRPAAPTDMQRARDALHAELRRKFGRDAPVIATLTLPSGWLERTLGDADAKLSPLSELRSAALRLEPAGDGFVLEAMLGHGSVQAAEQVEKLARDIVPELKPWLEAQLGPRVAAQLVPTRDGATLRFSLLLTHDELEKLLAAVRP